MKLERSINALSTHEKQVWNHAGGAGGAEICRVTMVG